MASSYTTNSGIEKPAQGDQTGEWGTTINTNMDIIDRSINGVLALSLSGTTTTLTTTDGSLTDGMYKVLVLGGSPSGTNTITVAPNDADKLYFVVNSSGQTATFTQGSGANVNVLNGDTAVIYCDGAGSGAAVADFTKDLGMSSVNIDGGTIDGAIIGGASAAAGTFTTLDTSGAVNLNLTTDSSSSTSGALIVDGGVGIAKKLYVGTDADIDGTLEADAMTLNGSAITTTATLSTGISNTNVPVFTSGVADDDFLRVAGTSIEGRSASEVLSDIGGQASLTFGISNTNAVKIDSASVADDEYARFTANGLESRSTAEVLSDIGGSAAAGSSSIVTTGALDAGSITSGFGAIDNGTSNIRSATITAETAFVPDASGGADLGTTSLEFNDLFLNDAGSIKLGDDQDVTITHVADTGITLNDKDIAGVSSINSGQIGGRRNLIYNPTFSVNQRFGTGANTTMNTYAMDRWRCFGGGTGAAHSWTTKSDAGEGDQHYSRFQRPADNTATHVMGITQGLETRDSKAFAGKEVTLSFRARGGANWSPTNGTVGFGLAGGEGTDENPVSMTNTNIVFRIDANIPQGGGFVTYSGTGTIPTDKTQLSLQISWTPVGTAGANDYWDVREVQLEIGGTVTQFEQRTYNEELQLCQRYCSVYDSAQNSIMPVSTAQVDSANRPEYMLYYPIKKSCTFYHGYKPD